MYTVAQNGNRFVQVFWRSEHTKERERMNRGGSPCRRYFVHINIIIFRLSKKYFRIKICRPVRLINISYIYIICIYMCVCVSTRDTIYNIILHKTNENNNNKTNKININLVVCHVHSSLWQHLRRRDIQICK